MTVSPGVSGRIRVRDGTATAGLTVELWDERADRPSPGLPYDRIGSLPSLVRSRLWDAPLAIADTDDRGAFAVDAGDERDLPERYRVRVYDGATFLGEQSLSASDAGESDGTGGPEAGRGDWLDVVVSGKGAAVGLAGVAGWYLFARDDDSDGPAEGDVKSDAESDGTDPEDAADDDGTGTDGDGSGSVSGDGEGDERDPGTGDDGEREDDTTGETDGEDETDRENEGDGEGETDGEEETDSDDENDGDDDETDGEEDPDGEEDEDEAGEVEYSPRESDGLSSAGSPSFSPDVDEQARGFLAEGRQEGVDETALVDRRLSVFRGRVVDRDGDPIPDVTVRVKDHREFGATKTDEEGSYALAVTGGRYYALVYEKEGYLPVQRRLRLDTRDYDTPGEVVLVDRSENASTTIAMGADQYQVVGGPEQEDADGARSSLLIVPPGTEAVRSTADELTFHVVEYTVGERGQAAMPARLPSRTGYTYATEYLATGTDVERPFVQTQTREFTQPVIHYNENFLGFPVGDPVPTGLFERDDAQWAPIDDGLVVGIVGVTDGVAALDVDGDGSANNPSELEALGITEGEREQLASAYDAGTELWRAEIPHFTPFDCNWGVEPPDGAENPPDVEDPETEEECES